MPEQTGETGTTASITGLSVGHLYGFRVRARNTSGVSDWSDIAWERVPEVGAKPGRMNHPKLQIGEAQGSVDLSWWKPVSGGAPTSYEYQYRQAGGSWTVVTGQSGYSATHTGLPCGVAYQFQVRARNTAGAGEWSYHDSWITLPTSAPSAPTNFVLQPGATTIHVSFGGAEPARYWQIQIAEVGQDWSAPPDDYDEVKSRVYMIRGLSNGKSYRVRVRGWNPEGYGPWSSNHNVALIATFPDPISVGAAHEALQISWPAVPETASYSVRHRLQGSTEAWTTATGIAGLAHTLGGLSAGTAYELQVGAVKGSTTTWSVLAHGTPHGNAGVLDPPTHFGIQARASQSITLSWRDDEDSSEGMTLGAAVRGSALTVRSRRLLASEGPSVEYEVQYKVQGETWDDAESVTVSALQATIGDLEPSTTYRFRVRTLGDDGGASGWTETIEGTTATEAAPEPTDPPERLARPSIEIGDEQLTVSWTAPGEDAPSIDTYDLDIALKGKGWKSGPAMRPGLTETAEVVDELTNGVHYAFRVRGVNALGEGSWSRTAYAIPVAGPPAFEEGDAPAVSVPAGEAMDPVTLPAASGGSGTLSYSLTPALPDGLSFETATRVLSGTPAAAADEGTWTLTATDEAEASATLSFTLEVLPPAAGPPSFAGVTAPAVGLIAGEAMAPVTLPAASGGSGTLSYALSPALPDGLSFEAATRVLSGTPAAAADEGTWTLTATDENEASATLDVTLTVTAPGTPPSYAGIDSPALEFLEGSAIDPVTLPSATGGNGALTYALAADLGNGLAFEAATRVISGTPAAPAATTTHTLTATDADGDTATLAFTLVVKADLQPTYEGIDSPALAFTEGEAIDPVTLPAATGGDGALTYTVSPALAAGLAFDAASRTLSGTPETEADSATWTLAAMDADNDTAELTFTIAVAPPPATRPENLEVVTSAQTAWKALDVAFDAPPASSSWVAAKSQIRVLGMKPGAKRTGWRPFASVTVEDGRAQASTASWMAIGRVYEVEVRWCEANGRTCSEASDMVYGASPASVPTDAGTAVTEPVSETALLLHWSISPIGGKKNLQAAYEIGYSTQTDAETPETLLADVPAFGTKEAEIDGLESGTAYRLYVRSVIDWQGTWHFSSDWASATATTPAGAESLARQQLQGELAKHARALLEDTSTVIGQRFTAGSGSGGDALTALASVFGGAGGSAVRAKWPWATACRSRVSGKRANRGTRNGAISPR